MSLKTEDVIKYINLVRQYPKYYVALLDEQINSFTDDLNMQFEEETVYETIEGQTAWQEAKTFLMNQEPLRPFDLNPGLRKAAEDHVRDIVKHNSSGHQGSDGSTFVDRVHRYCKKGKGNMIELIGTTHLISGKNPIELALINLIVDDGVNNRGHRKALFSKEYKYIGVDFIIKEDKVFSVIALTQANLEEIKSLPMSIATSTSHLKTMTQLVSSENKEPRFALRSNKENSIDGPQHQLNPSQIRRASVVSPQSGKDNHVWTLKNVNSQQKPISKKSMTSKHTIEQQHVPGEPSILREVQNSMSSKQSIRESVNQKSVFCSPDARSSKRQQSYRSQVKQSSLKSSQESIRSEKKQLQAPKSNGFGLTSKVQEYKIKNSTVNSPFLKTNLSTSGFGSTVGKDKRIVQKKELVHTWNEDQFLIKEVTTILKYEDGSVQDLVQRHSVLRTVSNSFIKDASL